jgi:hypothetical protein
VWLTSALVCFEKCGRGGLTNHHKGNKRFRDIVALHRPDYVRAPKIQKPSVARVIVRAIRNGDPPGRFLRKDERTGRWVDIGDKKAAEKTSQALREKINDDRETTPGAKSMLETGLTASVLLPSPASYIGDTFPAMMPNVPDVTAGAQREPLVETEGKTEGYGGEESKDTSNVEMTPTEADATEETVQTMSV